MKCFVPEISWHNRDPVYSIDFQPKQGKNDNFYRLASGGADCHVVIWYVALNPSNEDFASFECAADLQRHQKCVNVVRFSPSGQFLASGDDDGYIIVWKMREDVDPPELPGGESEKDKESWVSHQVLRGHLQDVYDLAWSPDSTMLASGSIDNTALLWDVEKRKKLGFLGDHKGFVQGVTWDPKGKFVATLSSDRNLRVFDASKRKQVARCFKGKLPAPLLKDKEADKEKLTKLFHNETLKTFFRRLCFSPLGDLLIAPCGVLEDGENNHNASYVFTRGNFSKPALHLPSPGLYTVAARCCPVLFKLRGASPSLFALPYRAVYTIATRNALVLYDTEQTSPFGYVGNIHYTGITDITWSPDGRLLIASSSEGYCSVITFDEGEIGEEYLTEEQVAEALRSEEKKAQLNEEEGMDIEQNEVEENKYKLNKIEMLGNNEKEEILERLDQQKTPEKREEFKFNTPTKHIKKDNDVFRTPERPIPEIKSAVNSPNLNNSQDSQVSELSICIDCDEEDLISKEEQARRLMSPYQGSPRAATIQSSPSRHTPKRSPMGSPATPKSGRRVNFITLSSPKSKRKL